jgi:hypothetical protein
VEIRIKVPDKIAAQARARGVRVETYVEELLTQQARADAGEALRHRTKEEIRAWLELLV